MPDFVRIQDNDTGGKATVSKEHADLLVEQGSAKVLKEDAVDAVFGTPLPAEPAEQPAKAKATAANTAAKGDNR